MAELKALDLPKVAEIHLFKTLGKVKAVAESGALESVLLKGRMGKGGEGMGESTVERMNVQARLFRSEGVRRVVSEAVDGVVDVLGIERGKGEVGKRRRLRARDYGNDGGGGGGAVGGRVEGCVSVDEAVVAPKYHDDKEGGDEQNWDGFSSPAHSDAEVQEDDNASFSSPDGDSNNNYEHYASRLAASSASDSDSESEDHSDSTNQIQPAAPRHRPRNPHSSSKQTTTSKLTKTTFLPSLLTSGYYSGASSDASSPEDFSGATTAPAPTRKNRMGQQARRALWEKKFKDRARHLRDRPAGEKDVANGNDVRRKGGRDRRDEDWGGRKGARSSSGGVGVGGKGRPERGEKGATGANGDVVGVGRGSIGGRGAMKVESVVGVGQRKGVDETPLHPSWEAARKAKEMKIGVKPVGRKVVF